MITEERKSRYQLSVIRYSEESISDIGLSKRYSESPKSGDSEQHQLQILCFSEFF